MVPGKTPSTVSGRPSECIQDDEPVCRDEVDVDPGLKKTSAALESAECKDAIRCDTDGKIRI